jgi:PAS domain S-box-containing protein
MDDTSRTRLLPYVVIGLVLTAIVWAITYRSVALEREQSFMQSAEQAKRLAGFFEQHALRAFRYGDSYLKLARREYIGTGSVDAIRKMLDDVPLDKSIISHITIIDATGKPLLVSGHEIKPGTTAKDRDYFLFQKHNQGDRIFVSLPHKGRNTGKLLIRLVRRITMPDGRFGGVIFAALEVKQITRFFAAMNLGPQSSATLVGTDKKIRARTSYGRLGPGQDISGSRIWRELEKDPVGLYRQTSVVDGITRYYAYRKLSEFPLIVAIGVSVEDITQAVTQIKIPTYVIAVLMTIVIAVLTILICREILVSKKLRDGEARIRTIIDSITDGIIAVDETGCIESFNIGAQKIFGYDTNELLGQDVSILAAEPDRSRHEDYVRNYCRTGERKIVGKGYREVRARRKDGTEFSAEISINEMTIGKTRCFVGTLSDITERKKLEEQLHQAQKMEALGQLTGGVAHDFNNLLAVILGNSELLGLSLRAGDKRQCERLDAIIRATTLGGELTQRLLAFARKQALRPQVVDLEASVAATAEILHRTLGETIEIETVGAGDLWPCKVDPSQLENALLNLALNARDAMPNGGKLTIETANVHLDDAYAAGHPGAAPGQYVMLAVTDTGGGMTPEVLEHAFEPFYTTKEVGKGSGLGLSMVYGFARQSDGHATVHSEAPRGTTVKLYLPRAQHESIEAQPRQQDAGDLTARGESVLVVEDDPDVRALAVNVLGSLGYRVREAGTGKAALEMLEGETQVDLLLTDVVLPGGMGGPDLAERARRRHAGLKVLYMSGYPENAMGNVGYMANDTLLLQKPFRTEDLARRVRVVLERSIAV